jgi:hypothetical protein
MDQREQESAKQSLAALVGHTNAQLKALDHQIISTSTNLQQSNANWDAAATLQKGIQELGGAVSSFTPPTEPADPSLAPPAEPIQGHAQPLPQQHPILPNISDQLDRIEVKLDKFLAAIDKLSTLDKKLNSFVERGLRDRVKQITLKLDDTKYTK